MGLSRRNLVLVLTFAGLIACSENGLKAAKRNIADNAPQEVGRLTDFVDQSINNAGVDVINMDLYLTTISSPANPIGAFVGGGQGNKAMAGLDSYDRYALSQLNSISFEAKSNSSSGSMYLNLLVDLDCVLNESTTATIADIRANRKILIADTFIETPKDDGYVEYSITKNTPNWLAVGGAGGLPASGPGATLTTFIANYPNACIVNANTADGGLGREVGAGCQTAAPLATTAPGYCGKSTHGILFILGDSVNLNFHQWMVRKISINNFVYRE